MGKKSLFQPTAGPVKAKKASGAKKAPAPKKASSKKVKAKAAVEAPPEPVISPVAETSPPDSEPEKNIAAQAPETTVPVVEPEPGGVAESSPPVAEIKASEEAAVVESPPEPVISPVLETSPLDSEPEKNIAAQAPETTAPAVEPEPGGAAESSPPVTEIKTSEEIKAPEPVAEPVISPVAETSPPDSEPEKNIAAQTPEAPYRPVETAVPPLEGSAPLFEKDPLIDGKPVALGIAGICGLILILLIASITNSGRYYVKESRGAVKIWKGNFSPAGRDRIMILHGAHWNGPSRDSYSREEVFAFAARYYLEKALPLPEASVSEDFDRMVYYLGRAREMVADGDSREAVAVIRQAKKNIAEARVLQASGEQAAVSLAREKLNAVGQALKALIAGLTAAGSEPAGAESGH